MNNASHTNIICPFLGLRDDPDSLLEFPSAQNYCYRRQSGASVRFAYQNEFCLSEKHRECSVFLNQQSALLPKQIRAVRSYRDGAFRKTLIATLSALLIIVLALGWENARQGLFSLGILKTAQTTAPALTTPTTTAVAIIPTMTNVALPSESALTAPPPVSATSVTATRTPKPTRTPTPTVTATRTATSTSIVFKRHLDIPIGGYYKFVIHKAKDGEKLETFAEKYNTSVAAIIAINYNLTNPVWDSVLFVIPVNFTNVANLPIFVVYQIKREEVGVSPEGLANELRVNPYDLKYYNDMLNPGERPLVGDLILVPWASPVQRVLTH